MEKNSFKEGTIANKFDAYNDILEQTLGFRFVFQTFISNPDVKNILDYGCGPGKVAYRLAESTDLNIIAVDESKEMLDIASEKRTHPEVDYHLIQNDRLSFLKNLFKAQKFDDAGIYRRMESQAALVGTDCAIELYPEAAIHLYFSLIIHPGDSKGDHSFRFRYSVKNTLLHVYGVFLKYWNE